MTEEQKTFADQKRKTVETAEFTEEFVALYCGPVA